MDSDLERKYFEMRDKIGFHVGRLLSVPMNPPDHVYFSLTNRCNLRCQMCSVFKHPTLPQDELPLDKVKDIVLQIKNMGIRHVIFSGGDPFMREDLFEVVEFAIKSGLPMVDLITNGTILNDAQVKKLVDMGLNHVTFSLDGLSPTNDEIRGKGVFAKAGANIDRINFYKKQLGRTVPTVGINFTIMNKNVGDILPMVDFAAEKGCNIILFQPILFNNTKMSEKRGNSLWLSPENIRELEKIVSKLVALKKVQFQPYVCTDDVILKAMPAYFRGKRMSGSFRCYEGIKRIVITSQGMLWSCSGTYGDLKTASLEKIWNSPEAGKMRKKVRVCKEHCLQDCVYFPSDILGELKGFIGAVGKEAVSKQEIKVALLGVLDALEQEIRSAKNKNQRGMAGFINTQRSLIDLSLMRQEVQRLS